MTALPVPSRASVDLSCRWLAANPAGWMATLDAARASGRTLLEVIHARFVAVRTDVAREAFEAQTTVAAIARRRLAVLAAERNRQPFKPFTSEVRANVGGEMGSAPAGGRWSPS